MCGIMMQCQANPGNRCVGCNKAACDCVCDFYWPSHLLEIYSKYLFYDTHSNQCFHHLSRFLQLFYPKDNNEMSFQKPYVKEYLNRHQCICDVLANARSHKQWVIKFYSYYICLLVNSGIICYLIFMLVIAEMWDLWALSSKGKIPFYLFILCSDWSLRDCRLSNFIQLLFQWLRNVYFTWMYFNCLI